MLESFKKHPYLTVFFLCFILGTFVVLPSIITGKGAFAFIDDFNQQEMPFNVHMNESIKNGNILYDFHNDLGASYIGSYSFYNVGSPFAIFLWLFPSSWTPYLLGPMYALKYAIAGLTAFLFLNRFVKNKKYAILGSILYSFSGFQFTNMIFYHFHDAVAFFPLLLYGLDRLIKDDKKGVFALSVALNLFTNYFFFIGQVVFVLLYYIVLNLTKHYDFTWKKFGQIALESILGVLMGCILLIPSIYFVISNPRVGGSWNFMDMLIAPLSNVLEIIRALLFPNDSMTFHSAINMMNYTSVEAYLPVVGSVFWLTYLIKKPKDSFSILMFVLFLFMFCPILNSTFFALTKVYYARWFYMAIMILVLLSIKALDEKLDFKIGLKATVIFLIVFTLLSILYTHLGNHYSYQPMLFFIICIVLFVNLIFVYFSMRSNKSFSLLLLGVCTYTVLYGNYFCFSNRILHQDEVGYVDRYNDMKKLLSSYENNVRFNHDESCERNILYYAGKMSITSWNSNIEGNAFQFYQSVNIPRDVLTKIPPEEHDLQDFLSVKYIVTCGDTPIDERYDLLEKEGKISIYENKDYLPLGMGFTSYITEEEFFTLSYEERKAILKETVVLTAEQIDQYKEILKHYQDEEAILLDHSLQFTKQGFYDTVISNQKVMIVYTFPYSDGFQAYVNGEKVKIEEVDHGLMGILINEGENKIEFRYFPKGLSLGIGLSILGFISYIGYILIGRKK